MMIKLASVNHEELFNRIQRAKYILVRQINYLKSRNASVYDLNALSYNLDALHEAERTGVRNLNEWQMLRINRVIKEVEEAFTNPN